MCTAVSGLQWCTEYSWDKGLEMRRSSFPHSNCLRAMPRVSWKKHWYSRSLSGVSSPSQCPYPGRKHPVFHSGLCCYLVVLSFTAAEPLRVLTWRQTLRDFTETPAIERVKFRGALEEGSDPRQAVLRWGVLDISQPIEFFADFSINKLNKLLYCSCVWPN